MSDGIVHTRMFVWPYGFKMDTIFSSNKEPSSLFGVVVFDGAGRLRGLNTQACRILGADAVQLTLLKLCARYPAVAPLVASGQRGCHAEVCLRREEGCSETRVRFVPFVHSRGCLLIVLAIDGGKTAVPDPHGGDDGLSGRRAASHRAVLPVCCSCKKVRDGRGRWMNMEEYLMNYEGLLFSHGLCPACACAVFEQDGLSGLESARDENECGAR